MVEVKTICPVCETDISITDRDIRLARQHKGETGNKLLISCPNCCRALILPPEMPEGELELKAWITSVEDCCCVPLLNDEDVRLPNGCINNLGKKVYRPGGGGPALMKRPYMFRYGIDPAAAWAKMGPETTPFKIGGT